MGIAGFANPEEQHAIAVHAFRGAFQQRESSRLADRDAAAMRIEWAAGVLGKKSERVEAIQRRQAQRIHPAHHGRVYQPARHHAPR